MNMQNTSASCMFSNKTRANENKFACGELLYLSSAVLMFIVATVTTVGNSLLLLTIKQKFHRLFRAPSTFLIANLGVSDLLVGLLVGYTVAVRDVFRYHQHETTDYIRVFIEVIEGLTLYISSCTIIALSVDRYIAVSDPMGYRSRITKERIKVFVLLLWLSAALLCCLPLTGLPKRVYSIVYLHTHGTIPIFVLTLIYSKMLRAFSSHQRQVEFIQNTTINKQREMQLERKMTYTVCIILGLFYLTLLPAYVTFHLLFVCSAPKEQSITLLKADFVATRFLFLNSAVNPYVYAWRLTKYRQGFLRLLPLLKPKGRARVPDVRKLDASQL